MIDKTIPFPSFSVSLPQSCPEQTFKRGCSTISTNAPRRAGCGSYITEYLRASLFESVTFLHAPPPFICFPLLVSVISSALRNTVYRCTACLPLTAEFKFLDCGVPDSCDLLNSSALRRGKGGQILLLGPGTLALQALGRSYIPDNLRDVSSMYSQAVSQSGFMRAKWIIIIPGIERCLGLLGDWETRRY